MISRRDLILLAVLLGAASWPTALWWSNELLRGQEGPRGLTAVAVAVGVLLLRPREAAGQERWVPHAVAVWLALSVFLSTVATVRIAAAAVVCAWATSLSGWRWGRIVDLPLLGLAVLALPIVDALQFYVGYPARAWVAWAAAMQLQLVGLGVQPEGALLRLDEQIVSVDPACSGIGMLRLAGVLTLGLAGVLSLSTGRTLMLGTLALALVLLANTLRVSSLFFVETGLLNAPDWLHEAIGVAASLVLFASLASMAWTLRPKAPPPAVAARQLVPTFSFHAIAPVALVAALFPLLYAPPRTAGAPLPEVRWPEEFEGKSLTALPLTEVELRFEENFPGRLGRFTDGRRVLILRRINQPNRIVHSITHCFASVGWTVRDEPPVRDADGQLWAQATVERGGEQLRLRERYRDEAGASWPDVGAWYWNAARGTSTGPWWGETLVERARSEEEQ